MELVFRDIPVEIFSPQVPFIDDIPLDQKRKLVREDFRVLLDYGIDRLIRERFIPWLKGEQFPDREDDRILDGLRLTNIQYTANLRAGKYSPTGEKELVGEFSFLFESGDDYTADMLECVEMEVDVWDDQIWKVTGYDV